MAGKNELDSRVVAHAIPLFEQLGFSLSLDWDDELLIAPPKDIDVESVCMLLRKHTKAVTAAIKNVARHERAQLFGGPFNGEPNHYTRTPNDIIRIHVRRGRWAVYKQSKDYHDPRAYFIGYATSEQKARRQQVTKEQQGG